MMHVFQGWQEEGREASYPFDDWSSFVADNNYVLPRDFVLDASLYPIANCKTINLTVISVSSAGLQVTCTADSGEQLTGLLAGDTVYMKDAAGRDAGILVLDATKAAQLAGANGFEVSFSGLCFVASTVCPLSVDGVTGVAVEQTVFSSDVWLVGEQGVVISNPSPGVIRFDAVGDPGVTQRFCPEKSTIVNYVKSIGDALPANNIIQLSTTNAEVIDSALRIYPSHGGIQLEIVGATAPEKASSTASVGMQPHVMIRGV